MRHWLRTERPFGAEGMNALGLALGYRAEVRSPLRLELDEEDGKIVELTDDQAWALSFVANRLRAAVTGPAGSGKTLLAIQVAKRLAARGHRTLLTCVTRRLAEHLRRATAGERLLEVHDFRDLAERIASQAGLAAGQGEASDVRARAAARVGPRFDAIVVDEAHDFEEGWWPALLALHTDPDEGRLFVFADDNPRLAGGAPPVSERVRLGPRNLRNTAEIGEFVSVLYEGERKPSPGGPAGPPVEILDYDDDLGLDRLLGAVLRNLVEQEGIAPADIAVLTPSGSGRLLARREVAAFPLSDSVSPGAILATSVGDFKGLEREVVILAEIGDEHLDDLRRLLYEGASRARRHLIVLASPRVAKELRRLTGLAGT
jgi:hypothetical protein